MANYVMRTIDGIGADVLIFAADGEMRAHRSRLHQFEPFKSAFIHPDYRGVLNFTFFKSYYLKIVLEWLYGYHLTSMNYDDAVNLLPIARFFKLELLTFACYAAIAESS